MALSPIHQNTSVAEELFRMETLAKYDWTALMDRLDSITNHISRVSLWQPQPIHTPHVENMESYPAGDSVVHPTEQGYQQPVPQPHAPITGVVHRAKAPVVVSMIVEVVRKRIKDLGLLLCIGCLNKSAAASFYNGQKTFLVTIMLLEWVQGFYNIGRPSQRTLLVAMKPF